MPLSPARPSRSKPTPVHANVVDVGLRRLGFGRKLTPAPDAMEPKSETPSRHLTELCPMIADKLLCVKWCRRHRSWSWSESCEDTAGHTIGGNLLPSGYAPMFPPNFLRAGPPSVQNRLPGAERIRRTHMRVRKKRAPRSDPDPQAVPSLGRQAPHRHGRGLRALCARARWGGGWPNPGALTFERFRQGPQRASRWRLSPVT